MSRIKKYGLKKQNLEEVRTRMDNILKVKKQLRKKQSVSSNSILDYTCGLCYNGLNRLPELYRISIFESWKHYSGDNGYPVHTSSNSTPSRQFDDVSERGISKYIGKYGKYRLKLAKHALKVIEKDLKKFK